MKGLEFWVIRISSFVLLSDFDIRASYLYVVSA